MKKWKVTLKKITPRRKGRDKTEKVEVNDEWFVETLIRAMQKFVPEPSRNVHGEEEDSPLTAAARWECSVEYQGECLASHTATKCDVRTMAIMVEEKVAVIWEKRKRKEERSRKVGARTKEKRSAEPTELTSAMKSASRALTTLVRG